MLTVRHFKLDRKLLKKKLNLKRMREIIPEFSRNDIRSLDEETKQVRDDSNGDLVSDVCVK